MTCKFAYESLVSVPISSFKNTLNQKYLQSFVRFTSMEAISIYCVFLPMFGKLRLYERHQTPTSYQVLSMQIRLVNHLRQCCYFMIIFHLLGHIEKIEYLNKVSILFFCCTLGCNKQDADFSISQNCRFRSTKDFLKKNLAAGSLLSPLMAIGTV